jgi:hypothetical protein
VDGTLAARDRASVEAHLAGCAACRAGVAELRSLSASATSLPKSIEPGRDLWPAIANRIQPRAMWKVQPIRWRRALAAAAVLVVAFGIYRLLPPSAAHYRPVREGWAAVQADFERASDDLSRVLTAGRERLRPETVALLERNLPVIDAAIAESRDALARDPGNPELRRFFAAVARQKVELLRWAARVAAS